MQNLIVLYGILVYFTMYAMQYIAACANIAIGYSDQCRHVALPHFGIDGEFIGWRVCLKQIIFCYCFCFSAALAQAGKISSCDSAAELAPQVGRCEWGGQVVGTCHAQPLRSSRAVHCEKAVVSRTLPSRVYGLLYPWG